MGASYKIRVAYFVIKERRKRKACPEWRSLIEGNTCAVRVVVSTAYRGLDDVNHGKVPACSESVKSTSIIRGIEHSPRIN